MPALKCPQHQVLNSDRVGQNLQRMSRLADMEVLMLPAGMVVFKFLGQKFLCISRPADMAVLRLHRVLGTQLVLQQLTRSPVPLRPMLTKRFKMWWRLLMHLPTAH
jgi:hypothetical protein